MNQSDVVIKDGGRNVTCRIQARSLLPAHRAHVYADENQPIGYVLLRASIARRKRGGKVRFLRLNYTYTGKSPEPPMESWEEWDETLQAEQKIARGVKDENTEN
jgi:hypothetical protein